MWTSTKPSARKGGAIYRIGKAILMLCAVGVAKTAAQPAFAAGTIAGTDIQNIAEATYDTPSGSVTLQSNTDIIKVDELLDVTVTSTDPGDVTTSPGATGNVLTYRVTNTGNGSEALRLNVNVANGGDDFDPTLTQIVLDMNGNGVYDPGVDTVYAAGSNDPVLAPDQGIGIFVITGTPIGVTDGNRADVSLTAAAVTGNGAPGTSFPGAGQGGGNAVIGATGADDTDNGFLAVQAASISLLKAATVTDPFGGDRPVPRATITYSITASVTGAGALNNIIITDQVPAGTIYRLGTIVFQATPLTDQVDADQATFDGTAIRVNAGTIPAGQSRTVTFQVRIL